MAATKDTDGRDDNMSISETEVVLGPYIMVFEEESGTKAMRNTGVYTLGDYILLARTVLGHTCDNSITISSIHFYFQSCSELDNILFGHFMSTTSSILDRRIF